MITEVANISINDKSQDDLVPDILEIEVEEDVDKADVFRVRLALTLQLNGTWSYIDEDRFTLWNKLSIVIGYPSATEKIIDGYITHVDVSLSNDEDQAYIEVSGMDGSCLMDVQEKQLAWANKKDSEIAQQIFSNYGLSYDVEDSVAQHKESVSTIMQSETDIRFLKKLAARNGFECFVQGAIGYFRSPKLQDPAQNVLAIAFGGDTNLASLYVKVDGTPPTHVEIKRIDPFEKQIDTKPLTDSPLRTLGAQSLGSIRHSKADGYQLVKHQISSSTQEMTSRLRKAYEPASQFVGLEGEIDSRTYGKVLRAKKTVAVKGAGANFSGLYYVTRVKHLLNLETYTQNFSAIRNGIGLTGQEDFSSKPALQAISAASIGAGAGAASSVVPAQTSAGAGGS
jgi:phage protein D